MPSPLHKKILLILDLDETLIFATTEPLTRKEDFKVGDYFVYKRPYLAAILQSIHKHFTLAVWSSASDDYVTSIVEQITPPDVSFTFIWGRSRCTYKRNHLASSYLHDDYQEYYYTKPLKKVKKKGYSLEKILIVDDSPYKVVQNYGNAIYPKEYRGDLRDEELKYLATYLETLKDCKNVRTVEKRGWRAQIDS
ncbi:MAG: NIF family HAD-type phosphatase [Thermonemataceae bacterium]